jgi:hypothetical protein
LEPSTPPKRVLVGLGRGNGVPARGLQLMHVHSPRAFRYRLWYGELDAISNAVGYAKFYSRPHDAVIRVYDEAGNVIETHQHKGDFKEWYAGRNKSRHAAKRDG